MNSARIVNVYPVCALENLEADSARKAQGGFIKVCFKILIPL